tara:strand:+ start:239 stop:655 length:417 start_codon:yes stop_codon:yes gene_type:complete
MGKKIDHIGIAVSNLEATKKIFETIFKKKASKIETIKSENVKTTFLEIGESKIELVEDLKKEGVINNFINKKGEGIHHLAIQVDNILEEISRLKKEGFSIINNNPAKGANGKLISFLHPKETGGVLIEICQKKQKYGI